MNSVARELGMNNTIFRNSTGWPDPEQNTSAKDLSILSTNLIKNFPDLYKMFAEIFYYNGSKQGNRNPILYNNLVFGADGLKTGHTGRIWLWTYRFCETKGLKIYFSLKWNDVYETKKAGVIKIIKFCFS